MKRYTNKELVKSIVDYEENKSRKEAVDVESQARVISSQCANRLQLKIRFYTLISFLDDPSMTCSWLCADNNLEKF